MVSGRKTKITSYLHVDQTLCFRSGVAFKNGTEALSDGDAKTIDLGSHP
jgi:hypothetical protein